MNAPQQERALRTPDADSRVRDAALPPARIVQRKCGCGGSCGSCADEEKKKKIQRRALGDTTPEIPKSVESILGSPGRPLDAGTRASMESRFGRSFADVRVHTDSHAAASARAIDAAAYTSGTHVVFGAGRFEPQTLAGRRLLAHELAHVVQQRSGTALPSGIGPANDEHERAADRIADSVVAHGPVFAPPPLIAPVAERFVRRKRDDDAPATEAVEPPRFIVEDDATPAAGQMKRKAFVDELDAAICATSKQEMGRLGRSTDGCPLLEQWRPRIRAMSAKQLEVSLRRWAGEGNEARSARDYIPLVSQRLAQSIRVWSATGQVVGVPPDLMELLGGGKIKVGVGSLLRGAIGGLFRKARDGAPAPASSAPVSLAEGRPLEGGVASRMGAAFGRDFSNVRIHTGADAASAAAQQNARAFTIGSDIAFAGGEYAPGTIVGDALLAHELAHVAQQDGARNEGPLTKSEAATGALEHDADNAAVHAVVSLWPGVRRFARGMRKTAMPRLKSKLGLQRCTPVNEFKPETTDVGAFTTTNCSATEVEEIRALHPEAIGRVRTAVKILSSDKVADFDASLQKHFHVTSKDATAVGTIRDNFSWMLGKMISGGVEFACVDYTDAICDAKPGTLKTAETARCYGLAGQNASTPSRISLCGNHAARKDSKGRTQFLWEEATIKNFPQTRTRTDWVKTLIHEYAHTLCEVKETSPGIKENQPVMLGAGEESYSGRDNYPGATPITNPDSYASFAMEAPKLKS